MGRGTAAERGAPERISDDADGGTGGGTGVCAGIGAGAGAIVGAGVGAHVYATGGGSSPVN